MSALIGYNLGVHTTWFRKLAQKIKYLIGCGEKLNVDNIGGGEQQKSQSVNYGRYRRSFPTNPFYQIESETVFGANRFSTPDRIKLSNDLDESKMSDHTFDSAIDTNYYPNSHSDSEDIEDQIYELMSYNNIYNEYYNNRDTVELPLELNEFPKLDVSRKDFRSKTVDRIDQVLHQIDDIKKSIVEIDGDLFHVTGSTYANFNPDFLILTNADELEESFAQKRKPNEESMVRLANNRKLFKSNLSYNHRHLEPNHEMIEYPNKSGYATSNSDGDSLQLEWDFEEDYDFYDQTAFDDVGASEQKTNEVRERLPSMSHEMPMTDEQKLKNMHDLLDEAKKLGLLNNILDALNPTPPNGSEKVQSGCGNEEGDQCDKKKR